MEQIVTVVGGGLAGSECALQLARRGVRVRLFEQRPAKESPAHHGEGLAELVCSNSLKSTKPDTAAGLLKEELDLMGCELLPIARSCSVPAGGALAVDREAFSRAVTERVEASPLIELVREEVTEIPDGPCVIAAGPLCSDALFSALSSVVGGEGMSFFDAAAPIVDAESLDRSVVFEQSRYGEEGTGDYLNCPMGREEYDAFMEALLSAERVLARDFEQAELFCACQPVEEVARTGHDSLRFGALKPVGLTDPRTGRRPWAAVQLRAESASRAAYNLVGFQTNLKFPEQKRVFSMIPGLEQAVFARYGVMHRNTFLNSPKLLNADFSLRQDPRIFFAGQITGVEGYMESASSGLIAGIALARRRLGLAPLELPATTMLGALTRHVSAAVTEDFQPMGSNMGILPPLPEPVKGKSERYAALSARALSDLETTLSRLEDF